ncbi:MAG: epoxyqueuosine reductase QueH [Coriobacteriia bacterium]|nr:epoxyqueuosine reductase QueH [Coriobacteriia bacterium]
MRIALHTCCGPCLIEPLEALQPEAAEVVAVFANPNIQSIEEYLRRREALLGYVGGLGVEVVELADPALAEQWAQQAGVWGVNRERRCRICYRIRLTSVAKWAAEKGLDAFATTLSVSPYQDYPVICDEGWRAAKAAGVAFLDRDFRDRYAEVTRRSRDLGMYRQKYCGCSFSEVEAEQQRRKSAARRKRRGTA